MADTKISALPAATLPLAGTEVLPIVQSGTTDKVAVQDLNPQNLKSNATTGRMQIIGPGAGSTSVMTIPNANFTAARTDSAQTFSGIQTFSYNTSDYTVKILNTLGASTGHGLYVQTRWNTANNYIARFATNSGSTNVLTVEGNNNVTVDSGNLIIGTSGKGITTGGSFALGFGTNGSTSQATIDTSGQLLVGKTSSAVATVGAELRPGGVIVSTLAGSTNATDTLNVYSTGAGAYRFYLQMDGKINATSTTIAAISDQRLKENIRDIDVGLDAIMALKPRKFDWKAGKGKNIKGDRGWIAQEFEQVFPEMIGTWKDEPPEGEAPYKSVAADLIPVLVKAIQEQQTSIQMLMNRIAVLEVK